MEGLNKFYICVIVFLLVGTFLIGGERDLSEKIDGKILERFDAGEESVRVIVNMKEKIPPRGFEVFSKGEISKEEIKTQARDIVGREKIRHEFVYSNSFSAELTLEEIKNLEESGLVEEIYYDYPVRTFLQDSVPLINATSSWSLQSLGINLTGEGQTVCVIDTGVDFTHPALMGKNLTCNIDCYNKNCIEDCSVLDDHGHGTHVAGIVGAYGGINGTAIGTKIIGVKILGSSGSGDGADIGEAVGWCINKSQDYNISVISMSLGSDQQFYYNYCPETFLVTEIDKAFNKNISVVIATGNNGSSTGVFWPSCIQNATRVGSSLKTDNSFSSFSNRWALSMLLAPGGVSTNLQTQINSTWNDNQYYQTQGTSMATPHVAGAIAILKQYLSSINVTKTPKEIEDVLFRTGKTISTDERNYSRIDVYSALMDLDVTPPNVTLISPENSTINFSTSQTFVCNSVDWQLKNATFYLWDSLGEIYNSSLTNEISGTENQTEFNLEGIEHGQYEWNCLVCDENSNCNLAENNFSISVVSEEILARHYSPEENYETNNEQIEFICESFSGTDSNLTNVTLEIFYVQNGSNISLFNRTTELIGGDYNLTEFSVNFSEAEEGNHSWSCLAYNSESNYSLSENRTLIYDITFPLKESLTISKNYNSATITLETNEATNYSLELFGKGNNHTSEFSFVNSYSFSGLSSSTAYSFNITFCDKAGNCNFTEGEFTTDSAPVVRTSGGGGGGTSVQVQPKAETYNLESKNIEIPQVISVKRSDKVLFKIENNSHSIEVVNISGNQLKITLRSEPINITLISGQEKKINLTSPDYYDLSLKLESVENSKANLSLAKIFERIEKERTVGIFEKGNPTEVAVSVDYDHLILKISLGLFALMVLLFIVYKIFKRLEERTLSKKKEKPSFYFFQHG